ncbi:MAG: hypothetical protein RMJ51_05770 [Candidatus Calescibacterium sp.]|nr:hypothetical protein [Candidatus Calescibacterium sp.]MDW8195727.1 hypothetical protein [Candidatus Calescibacterium sp.]
MQVEDSNNKQEFISSSLRGKLICISHLMVNPTFITVKSFPEKPITEQKENIQIEKVEIRNASSC